MKRLIILFSFLLFAFQVDGQIIRANPPYVAPATGGGTPFDGGMINNGDFANGDHWGWVADWSLSDGKATFPGGSNGYFYQTAANMITPTAASTEYTIEYDFTGVNIGMELRSSNINDVYTSWLDTGDGHKTHIFTTPASIGVGGLAILDLQLNACTLDNFTMTETP